MKLSFEERLRRFREAQAPKKARAAKKAKEQQEKEQKRLMGKSHRREVAKKIAEQIAAATDPQVIARLSNELSKYLPRPKQIKRKPTKAPVETKRTTSLLDVQTGNSLIDNSVDGARLIHHLVLEVANKCRARGGLGALSRSEKDSALEGAKVALPPGDRATVEAYCAGLTEVA